MGRRRRGQDGRSRTGWRLLALPLVCNMASLVVLAIGWGNHLPVVAAWMAIGCVLAALARTTVTFREVRNFNEVKQQARTDELTGLANRRALLEETARVLTTATARRPAALLLLDLDGFKEVNDSLGHGAGDQLLRQVGPRLQPGLRPGELLARLGGDEFAVLLPDAGLDEAEERAARLRKLIRSRSPSRTSGCTWGSSIGVATAPVPAASVQELLRCADVAMYTAKSGREGVHVYVPDPHGGTGDRLRPWKSCGPRSPPASWRSTSSRRSTWPTAGSWAWRPSSGGTTRPAASSPPPSSCPRPGRPACCARSPTPCSSWR